jgi:hypothetical protein
MSKETLILIVSWGIAIVLLIWKVPRNKIKDAQIVFLFAQSLGWLYVFVQSYFNNLVFPIREFPKATDMLVSLHFIIYPTFCVFFVLYFPETSKKWKIILHYLVFVFLNQSYEMLLERYTKLIDYKHLNALWGFLIKTLVYYCIYRFYRWYIKRLRK